MRTFNCSLVLMLTVLSLRCTFAASSAAGLWMTNGDKTGEKGAVVELIEQDGVLTGRIVRVFSQSGDAGVCEKCSDDFKDKPIIGLQFMWGLKDRGGDVWDDGRILDARNGHIYHAKVSVKDNKLHVRGYLGIALLGQTQVWVRA